MTGQSQLCAFVVGISKSAELDLLLVGIFSEREVLRIPTCEDEKNFSL